MNWYYVAQGQQAGPLDDAQLEQMRANGTIQDDTLIWHEGLPNWQPYREVKGGAAAPPPPMAAPAMPGLRLSGTSASTGETPDAVCVECKNMFPKHNMIRYRDSWVCATCKPVFMQKLAEGAQLNTGEMRYAGFWIRFAAKLIDGVILGLALVVPLVIIGVLFAMGTSKSGGTSQFNLSTDHTMHATSGAANLFVNLMTTLFQFLYVGASAIYSGFFNGKYGATPGKMACKLIVVDANGAPISYGRAFGRGFAEIVSGLICNIGYIIAAFDGQKRALHDHICSTRVIYK